MNSVATFHWQGIDAKGKKMSGNLSAHNKQVARQKLVAQNITPLNIKKHQRITFEKKSKPRHDDIINFTRNLSTLVNANLTLQQALSMLAKSDSKKNMRELISKLAEQLNRGTLFSEALQNYSQHFNTVYISLIRCAEQSGQLALMLQEILQYLESNARLKKRLKKAMSYPIVLFSITTIISMLLLIFVIPQFKSLFDSYHAPLPKLTLAVLACADFLRTKSLFLAVGIFFFTAATIKSYRKFSIIKTHCDKVFLRLPIYGNLTHKATLTRILQSLSVSHAASVPLEKSLTMITTLSSNTVLQNALTKIKDDIIGGKTLADAFDTHDVFPSMMVQMIHIGEQTGTLAELLKKQAHVYQEEVDSIVINLSSLIEPFIIVFLGAVIGTFVLAMYLPIFKLGSIF